MSSLIKSLKASLAVSKPRSLGKNQRINMLAKVVEYKDKTIVVEAMNGIMAGQTMEIGLPKKNTKMKMENFTTSSKQQTSMYTEVGGYLRFDGVTKSENGETYDCGWINSWIKTPSDDHKVIAEAQIQINKSDRTTSSGFPDWRLTNLEASQETKVGTFDELKEVIEDALASHRGALIVDISGGEFASVPVYLPGKKIENEYVYEDPHEVAEKMFGSMDAAKVAEFEGALASGSVVVVPMLSLPIGGKTAEEVVAKIKDAAEKGKAPRIMSVNTEAYAPASIGARLTNALARKDRDGVSVLPAEYAERLATAFTDVAAEEAKAAFHSGGWNAVADIDLQNFFASRGVELKKPQPEGWNTGAIHLQRFEGGDSFFVAKTHELQRYANPYPDLEITKDLRRAFANELVEAVKLFMEVPEAAKTAEAQAPAAAAAPEPEVDTVAAEAQAQVEALDIDDMINDVLNG